MEIKKTGFSFNRIKSNENKFKISNETDKKRIRKYSPYSILPKNTLEKEFRNGCNKRFNKTIIKNALV